MYTESDAVCEMRCISDDHDDDIDGEFIYYKSVCCIGHVLRTRNLYITSRSSSTRPKTFNRIPNRIAVK